MRSRYHTVIIGAGPGGLAAAQLLASNGTEVLVLEKHREIGPKVCAGLLPFDERTEARYGPPDKTFSAIDVHLPGRVFPLALDVPFLAVYERGTLGQRMLASAQAAGAEIVPGVLVKAIGKDHLFAGDQRIEFQCLVGADGANSIVRRKLGIPLKRTGTTFQYRVQKTSDNFELHLDYHTFGIGCAWVVPHAGYTLIGLGRDMDPTRVWPLDEQCRSWAASRGWEVNSSPHESWPISYDYRGWRFGNIFLIGDAGGFASGLTGEGIVNAIVSGEEAARTILNPRHRPTRLIRILRRKQQHERLMSCIRLSPSLANAGLRTGLSLARRAHTERALVDFLF